MKEDTKLYEEERKEMVKLLIEAINIIKKNDSLKLGDLSNHIIHTASIFQNREIVMLAVIIHALSKILERMMYLDEDVAKMLNESKEFLEKDDVQSYNRKMKKLLDHISKQDKRLGRYMQKVINEARIKKGANIYEHGVSLGQAADILGLTHWELMHYVGKTKIHDKEKEKMQLKERLAHARSLFNAKYTKSN